MDVDGPRATGNTAGPGPGSSRAKGAAKLVSTVLERARGLGMPEQQLGAEAAARTAGVASTSGAAAPGGAAEELPEASRLLLRMPRRWQARALLSSALLA